MPSSLRLHLGGDVARLEMADSNGYPRLSASLLADLEAQLDRLLATPACQGIVIHGSQKCFAAGAEIAEVAALTRGGVAALPFARRGQLLFEKIARASKPVLAAVAGYCLGGGLDLALSCGWRLATPQALFGHPGAGLGLLTGWGGTQRLPRLIGRGLALEWLVRGEPVTAEKAQAAGLVDEIVPPEELFSQAIQRARRLAANRAN